MDQWLVRTAQNWIAGPYTKEQICQMIREGKLGHQDEVCQSNEFWIFLHEKEEVKLQLGIEMPKPVRASGEEITETETSGDKTDPQHLGSPASSNQAPASAPSEMTREKSDALPEIPELSGDLSESTAILTNRKLREFQPKKKKVQEPAIAGAAAAVSLRKRGKSS